LRTWYMGEENLVGYARLVELRQNYGSVSVRHSQWIRLWILSWIVPSVIEEAKRHGKFPNVVATIFPEDGSDEYYLVSITTNYTAGNKGRGTLPMPIAITNNALFVLFVVGFEFWTTEAWGGWKDGLGTAQTAQNVTVCHKTGGRTDE
jgi:hypothetical protein